MTICFVMKAVECPSHLGVDENESQCDRIIDLESCYCAIFTKVSLNYINLTFQQSPFYFCLLK